MFKDSLKKKTICQSPYHARAVATVTVLDLGAWFMALTITALTGSVYVDGYLLVNSFCCLGECQLHDVLTNKRIRDEPRFFAIIPIL